MSDHWAAGPGQRRRTPMPKGWKVIRARVLERDNHTCQDCGGPATEVDHISDDPDCHEDWNLRSLCNPCHLRRSAQQGGQASARARAARPRLRPKEIHPGILTTEQIEQRDNERA